MFGNSNTGNLSRLGPGGCWGLGGVSLATGRQPAGGLQQPGLQAQPGGTGWNRVEPVQQRIKLISVLKGNSLVLFYAGCNQCTRPVATQPIGPLETYRTCL